MRKLIRLAIVVVGVIVLVVIAAAVYAVLNLNGIIRSQRGLILAKASDAVGRKVDVQDIHATLGWGVIADLRGVTIADDPNFSQTPFVQAADVYARVALMPLLSHRVEVEQVSLKQPVVHIIRNRRGELNVSTLGKKSSAGQAAAPPPPATGMPLKGAPLSATQPKAQRAAGAGTLGAVSVSSLTIDDATVVYQDAGAAPVTVSAVNLDIENLGVSTPFDIKLTLAALGQSKNFSLTGQIGPLMKNGVIDTAAIPLALSLDLGPFTMAELKAVPQIAKSLPPALTLTNRVAASIKLSGTSEKLAFNLATDLTANQVVYTGVLDKAAGVPLKLIAAGTRNAAGAQAQVEIQNATLTLGDLHLQAGQIQFGQGIISARVNSNRFDLASMGKMLVALSKYNASGKAEIHALVKVVQKKPEVDGVVTLASVTVTPPGKRAIVGGLTGDIKMTGKSAVVGPLTFNLGSGHGKLQAYAQSLEPISATYDFSADVVKPTELTANPKPEAAADHLDQLAVKGTIRGSTSAPTVTAQVTSPSGTLQNIGYRSLAVDASYGGQAVTISSLKLAAFKGTLDGNAKATLGAEPVFNVGLNLHGIDLQQALLSQKSKAADTVRGQLTGQVRVAGRGNTFDKIKPTLGGNGQMSVANGKLIGVNIGAQAMRKVQGLPGIDSLITPSIVARHPALFNSPDTDLRELSLTFTIQGPRITSHDIKVETTDYSALADGWFDLNKNIEMQARLLLSQELSREIMAEKKNVVYLANEQKQVDIPVRISGQLPKPSVQPDIQFLAQRAAGHLVEKQANKALGKLLGKKFGGLIPGSSPSPGTPGTNPAPSNPLAPLKNLFH